MSISIVIMVEGQTEKAFKPCLIKYLESVARGRALPKLQFQSQDGLLPIESKLNHAVTNYLREHDFVIALTDVYTGQRRYASATEARAKMESWVEEAHRRRFFAHAAQFEFEAWLIPYWDRIIEKAGYRSTPPARPKRPPEAINHDTPPSKVLQKVFANGPKSRNYEKVRDARIILDGADLRVAIDCCPELRAFVNRLAELSW